MGIFCYLLYFLTIPILQENLKIYNLKLFLIVGITVITSFVSVNLDALPKGLRFFKLISVFQILTPVLKILI